MQLCNPPLTHSLLCNNNRTAVGKGVFVVKQMMLTFDQVLTALQLFTTIQGFETSFIRGCPTYPLHTGHPRAEGGVTGQI